MKIDSRRIERRTATPATIAMKRKAGSAPIRCQRACAAKAVAKRVKRPAPCSAFAVMAYRRATFISQPATRAEPTTAPMIDRTAGLSHPWSME